MTTLVIEHKTTSDDIAQGSKYWALLTIATQASQYMVGARALGFEPDGLLYDLLRKPALKPLEVNSKRSEPETPEAYRVRCLEAIAEDPDKYYQRGVVIRLEEEEKDAAYDAWQTAEQIRLSRNSGRWPRNTGACDAYHRLCDYFPICSGMATETDLRYEKTQAHPELDGKTHLPMLTASSAASYRSCPRKYSLAYEKGIRAKEPAGTLHFGTKIHLALEVWMKTKDLASSLLAMRSGAYSYDDAKAEAMIIGYDARWRDDPMEVLVVEKEFTAALVNPDTGAASRTWQLAGKLDGVVRRES